MVQLYQVNNKHVFLRFSSFKRRQLVFRQNCFYRPST